jgi:hypothetical protein
MRKFYLFFLALSVVACLSEKNVDPAQPATFTKYFSDGYANDAISVEETSDSDKGFIILANSTIQNSEAETARNRIVLIKTDEFGAEQWTKYYPENFDVATRWEASSISLIDKGDGGYLVTGTQIEKDISDNEVRKALLLKIDQDGTLNANMTKVYTTPYLKAQANSLLTAKAITIPVAGGNYIFLASSDDGQNKKVHVAEIKSTDLDTVWVRTYGQGAPNLTNRLFYSSDPLGPFVYWAGDWENASSIDGFVTKSKKNAQSTESGQTNRIGETNNNDYTVDFCQKGAGFGFLGYSDLNGDAGDIVFYQIDQDGSALEKVVYTLDIFKDPAAVGLANNKKEVGNSITATKDGGFIILGTIDTYTGILGRGNTDMLMLKINGFGERQWVQTYGSLDADAGSCIRQTNDGGYIVLGTTRLAAQRTILLVKTDKNGEVE